MNSVLDGDERRGAYAPISWLYFTGLVNIQRRSTGATYRTRSCPPRRPVRHDPEDSLSPALSRLLNAVMAAPPARIGATHTTLS
jgi:hypothetical protein